MNERQKLVENYADAVFSLLMDDLAGMEAERLCALNEALRADDSAAVPDDVYRRCIDKLDQTFREKRRAAKKLRARKLLRVLPVAAVLLLALSALAFAAFPQLQADVKNIFQSENSYSTTWSFSETSPRIDLESIDSSFTVEIPDGFFLSDFYRNVVVEGMSFLSDEDSDASISLDAFFDGSVSIDNDGYDVKRDVLINGHSGTLYVESAVRRVWITWADTDIPCVLLLESFGLSEDEAIRFAESVTYIGESG